MKILAIEFSSPRRSTAALCEGRLCAQSFSDAPKASVPQQVEHTLREAGWQPAQVRAIAIGIGPGSYAGIRAAIAFAQGWQLVRPIRLLGISSAEVIAATAHASGTRGPCTVLIDAQRGEFYRAEYELDEAGTRLTLPLSIVSATEASAALATTKGLCPDTATLVDRCQPIFPDAAMLARLAAARLAAADVSTPDETLEPIYLRAAQFATVPLATPPRVL